MLQHLVFPNRVHVPDNFYIHNVGDELTTDQTDLHFPKDIYSETQTQNLQAHINDTIEGAFNNQLPNRGDDFELLIRLVSDSKSSETQVDINAWAERISRDISDTID